MTRFNDLTYNYFIGFIINHFFNFSIKNLPIGHRCEPEEAFYHLHFETLIYSLVSWKWFNHVSYHINSLLKFKNFEIMNKFGPQPIGIPIFKERENSNLTSISISTSKYKLIKIEKSNKIYFSLQQYEKDQENGLANLYGKVLICCRESNIVRSTKSSLGILLSNKKFPDNVQFNLSFSIKGDYSMDDELSSNQYNNDYKSDFYKYEFEKFMVNKKRIRTLDIHDFNSVGDVNNSKVLENLNRLEPSGIIYRVNDDCFSGYSEYHCDSSCLFKNSSLRRFNFDGDYFEPRDLLTINNQATSLKIFNLEMKFNKMIRLINGENEFDSFFRTNKEDLQQDWNDLIKLLTTNKTIRFLILNNLEVGNEDLSNINTSCITEGFKSLFSNPECSIGTIEFNTVDFIDESFLNGLKSNNSIHTLIFIYTNSFDIINNVLPFNKSIKHLNYNDVEVEILFELFELLKQNHLLVFQQQLKRDKENNEDNVNQLQNQLQNQIQNQVPNQHQHYQQNQNQNQNYIELYSLTFYPDSILSKEELQKVLDEITHNSFNIKEYNIYVQKNLVSKTQMVLENGSIINFRLQ